MFNLKFNFTHIAKKNMIVFRFQLDNEPLTEFGCDVESFITIAERIGFDYQRFMVVVAGRVATGEQKDITVEFNQEELDKLLELRRN